jgi:para-aminobenzoate synthetase
VLPSPARREGAVTQTLLLDNYDSYTFNLFQLLAEVNGVEPYVVRNDGATWDELRHWGFDNVVISPGPGHPARDRDFGVCRDAIRSGSFPVLGVCLGHQGIGLAAGCRVVHAPEVMHGRLSRISHDGSGIFAGIPQGFSAVRYHSLCVRPAVGAEVDVCAWADDDVIMGIRHRRLPLWGVQFHPESICTEHGRQLIANFAELSRSRRRRAPRRRRPVQADVVPRGRCLPSRPPTKLDVHVVELDAPCDAEAAFLRLYADDPYAFWLDSSGGGAELARFSYLGGRGGELFSAVRYTTWGEQVVIERDGASRRERADLLDYLARALAELDVERPPVPFGFCGGFVGYLGYELKADCGGNRAHASRLPDGFLVFADRFLVFDHVESRVYAVALSSRHSTRDARRWLASVANALATAAPAQEPALDTVKPEDVSYSLSRPFAEYVEDVEACKRLLRDGETYEVCLTNQLHVPTSVEPVQLYRVLRRVNPAPFSAFLRVPGATVLSSSPERLLSVRPDRSVEAKPIKGTAPRGPTAADDARSAQALRASEKDAAENLMIVDLLRNDLGLVCETGSVSVPRLMAVESYATVHQLVSTVTGRLRSDLDSVSCVRACFPGGSMTGAPKRRTMEIIDALEGEARGVYSGAIGYFGVGGAVDLSVVIRTIVATDDELSIGSGGAIVAQSDPEHEFQELLLKANALLEAIGYAVALEREAASAPKAAVGGRL